MVQLIWGLLVKLKTRNRESIVEIRISHSPKKEKEKKIGICHKVQNVNSYGEKGGRKFSNPNQFQVPLILISIK